MKLWRSIKCVPVYSVLNAVSWRNIHVLLLGFCLFITLFCDGLLVDSSMPSFKSKCEICKDISKNFHQGLKKTVKSNFGGGNTNWEESRLGSYATSETRLVEVTEGLCEGEGKECHHMAEEYEELIEAFWNTDFRKGRADDFFRWFCIDNVKVCCHNNTYGSDCLSCTGGLTRPCSGNGHCDGEGTRQGTGKCKCFGGYSGELCLDCMDGYYEEQRNETHTKCKPCHISCKSTCWEDGPKGCDDCEDGWEVSPDEGCQDINECKANEDICNGNFYCENTQGSFQCIKCGLACQLCFGSGSNKCTACRDGYSLTETMCTDIDECADKLACTKEHETCTNKPGGYLCGCEDGYVMEDAICIPAEKAKKKSETKTSKQTSTKDKKNNDTGKQKKSKKKPTYTPSLLLFNLVVLGYGLAAKFAKGNVPVVGGFTVLLGIYLYWFASHYDKLKL